MISPMATTARGPGTPSTHAAGSWLVGGLADLVRRHHGPGVQPAEDERRHPWWRVMCLTGVDYFSRTSPTPIG